MLEDFLPDVLAESLARVVADKQREWDKDVARRDAEARAAIASLENRVLQLEANLRETAAKQLADFAVKVAELRGPAGLDGKDGERGDRGEKGDPGEPGPIGVSGPPGADADETKIADIVCQKVLTLIPQLKGEQGERGEKGDPGPMGDPGSPGSDADEDKIIDVVCQKISLIPNLKGERGERGEPGPMGEPGLPGAPANEAKIIDVVCEKISQIPDLKGERGEPGPRGERGIPGEIGKDGVPGRDGLHGRDGFAGKDGKDGLNGKDGAPGRDGADGLGFDDLTARYDPENKKLVILLERGDQKKEWGFELPIPSHKGIFKEGQKYKPGDMVTRDGSTWHCTIATSSIPGDGNKDWQLSVKRGRDGKDGKPGAKGEKGDPGRNGKDLTQLGHDGQKWG